MRADRVLRNQRGQPVPIEHDLLMSTSIPAAKIILSTILFHGIDTPAAREILISEFQGYFRQQLTRENYPYASLTPLEFASKMLTWLREYQLGIR